VFTVGQLGLKKKIYLYSVDFAGRQKKCEDIARILALNFGFSNFSFHCQKATPKHYVNSSKNIALLQFIPALLPLSTSFMGFVVHLYTCTFSSFS
jgi:hypothetical protein